MADLEMQIDLPRHIYRPDALAATAGQNFLYNPSTDKVYPLTDDQLFRQLPLAHRTCRVYLRKDHTPEQAAGNRRGARRDRRQPGRRRFDEHVVQTDLRGPRRQWLAPASRTCRTSASALPTCS